MTSFALLDFAPRSPFRRSSGSALWRRQRDVAPATPATTATPPPVATTATATAVTPLLPPNNTKCTGDKSCATNQILHDARLRDLLQGRRGLPARRCVCTSGLCTAPNTNPVALQCTTKADCGAGEECVGGKCQACGGTNGLCVCAVNADCASGQICSGGLCTDKSSTCTFSSECSAGQVCADGQCLTDCSKGQACPTGTTCSSKGVCEPTPGTQCTSNAQCSGGTPLCVDGSCTAQCSPPPSTSGCPTGEYCDQGAQVSQHTADAELRELPEHAGVPQRLLRVHVHDRPAVQAHRRPHRLLREGRHLPRRARSSCRSRQRLPQLGGLRERSDLHLQRVQVGCRP